MKLQERIKVQSKISFVILETETDVTWNWIPYVVFIKVDFYWYEVLVQRNILVHLCHVEIIYKT